MIVIGIDPGSTTGLAMVDQKRQTLIAWEEMPYDAERIAFWVIDRVLTPHAVRLVDLVVIERPRVFGYVRGKDERTNRKMAIDLGKNMERSDTIYNRLIAGLPQTVRVVQVAPKRGRTKWTVTRFRGVFNGSVVGAMRSANHHARDAAVLALLADGR